MNERICVSEEFTERPAAGCVGIWVVKKWVFTYSDGTTETVTIRVRK